MRYYSTEARVCTSYQIAKYIVQMMCKATKIRSIGYTKPSRRISKLIPYQKKQRTLFEHFLWLYFTRICEFRYSIFSVTINMFVFYSVFVHILHCLQKRTLNIPGIIFLAEYTIMKLNLLWNTSYFLSLALFLTETHFNEKFMTRYLATWGITWVTLKIVYNILIVL